MKQVFGLTGNIGCGKSTILAFFEREKNVVAIKTDDLAKDLLETPKVLKEISNFGPNVVVEGEIDHERLAEIAFNDRSALRKLEEVVHPLVWKKVEEIICENSGLFIVESAIIFETGSEKRFDKIICVSCSEEVQRNRLKKRGLSDEEITLRIRHQLSSEYKESRSDYVIRTDDSLLTAAMLASEIYEEIMEENNGY